MGSPVRQEGFCGDSLPGSWLGRSVELTEHFTLHGGVDGMDSVDQARRPTGDETPGYTLCMKKDWKTKLNHTEAQVPEGFRSLSTPVFRGSTVLFPNAAAVNDEWNQHEAGYTYGLYGTPTALELAGRICELEGGAYTLLTPGGQAALSLINLSFLKTG